MGNPAPWLHHVFVAAEGKGVGPAAERSMGLISKLVISPQTIQGGTREHKPHKLIKLKILILYYF